jgi:hypothetical protein
MTFLPDAMNEAFSGSIVAVYGLFILGLIGVLDGGIHLFAPDGGAGRLSSISLRRAGRETVFLLAIMGVHEIFLGFIEMLVAVRYREFLPLFLGLALLMQIGIVYVTWVHKPLPSTALGKYGSLVVLPLILILLILAF